MKIDRNKLKIKYLIGSYKNCSDYPTLEDLQFEIITFCIQNKRTYISRDDLLKIIKNENFEIDLALSKFLTISEKPNTYTVTNTLE